ncbi:MAG: nitrous oxide-stimulated promoter family protein [Tissierellaceae bacterium]
MSRIEKDKRILRFMIDLYCERKHKLGLDKCPECQELYDYAAKRLTNCRYGESKPSCKKCKTHCYRPEMKEKIKRVMSFSGPRVILYRPHQYIRYLLKSNGSKAE